MEIHLIRHTTPAVAPGVIYGQRLPVDLNDTFGQEAEAVSCLLAGKNFDVVLSSPAIRCTRLADRLFGSNYTTDHRLSEMDFGDWEGKTWNEIPAEELNAWMKNYETLSPPRGENMQSMQQRVTSVLTGLAPASRVAMITHAGVIRLILLHYGRLTKENMFEEKIAFGEVRVIEDQDAVSNYE